MPACVTESGCLQVNLCDDEAHIKRHRWVYSNPHTNTNKVAHVCCIHTGRPYILVFILLLQNNRAIAILKQRQCMQLKVCSYLTFAFASTSPSNFNIASMETQTQMHRMGLNPFLMFYIDVDANANVKCEHTLIQRTCWNFVRNVQSFI